MICNLSRREPDGFAGSPLRVHVSVDFAARGAVAPAARAVVEALEPVRPGPVLIIHNAGFGDYGAFPASGWETQRRLLDVNVVSVLELTAHWKPLLEKRGGAVILVASTAAWQPTPWLATYGASKTFLLNWGLALREEWREAGLGVTVLCPGPTETAFFTVAGMDQKPSGVGMHSADLVAQRGLEGWARGRAVVVPGALNQVMAAISCRLPRSCQGRIAGIILKRFRKPPSNRKSS